MKVRLTAVLLLGLLMLSVFGATYPDKPVTLIAPGSPGGGWDTTARVVAQVLKETGLVTQTIVVTNMPGGGGGIGLAHMQTKVGDPYTIIVFSPPLLLINLTGQTKYSFKDLTPLAMVLHDYGAFAVSKKSKYTSIKEIMEALKTNPKSVKVGGISAYGSMDHIQFLIAAKAAGVTSLKDITYVSFQEGDHLAALLGGHIDVLSTGLAETVNAVQAGAARVLAVTAPQRVAGLLSMVPTLREEGIDAEFVNWRGFFGPLNMPSHAVEYWISTFKNMVETPTWENKLANYGWGRAFVAGTDFKAFLEKTNDLYKEILSELGLYKGE